MFNIRRATPEDVEALVHLRLALLREAQDVSDDTLIAALTHATCRYLAEKIPTDEFIAWVAEAQGIMVGTSGLVDLPFLDLQITASPAQRSPPRWQPPAP
jgi:hypothetical protein